MSDKVKLSINIEVEYEPVEEHYPICELTVKGAIDAQMSIKAAIEYLEKLKNSKINTSYNIEEI